MELKGMVRQAGGMNFSSSRRSIDYQVDEDECTLLRSHYGRRRGHAPVAAFSPGAPQADGALGGERTLFQLAVDRLRACFPPRIFVVTVADQVAQLRQQCPEIPLDHFLVEPMPRGTASVVGLAAAALRRATRKL
jgi:hypothetical protein